MRRISVSVIRNVYRLRENGKLVSMCTYINGIMHGNYYLFHENGKLERKYTYENGRLVEKPMYRML